VDGGVTATAVTAAAVDRPIYDAAIARAAIAWGVVVVSTTDPNQRKNGQGPEMSHRCSPERGHHDRPEPPYDGANCRPPRCGGFGGRESGRSARHQRLANLIAALAGLTSTLDR